MTNRRITLELELSGEVMEAYQHLEAGELLPHLPGVSVCVVGDSHPPETPVMLKRQAN